MSGPCSADGRTVSLPASWARMRHRPRYCHPSQLPGEGKEGERRGREGRAGPAARGGGRAGSSGARSAPASLRPPPPLGGKCAMRKEGGPQPLGLVIALPPALTRLYQLNLSSTEKYQKRCKRPSLDTRAHSSPPHSSLAVEASVEGV